MHACMNIETEFDECKCVSWNFQESPDKFITTYSSPRSCTFSSRFKKKALNQWTLTGQCRKEGPQICGSGPRRDAEAEGRLWIYTPAACFFIRVRWAADLGQAFKFKASWRGGLEAWRGLRLCKGRPVASHVEVKNCLIPGHNQLATGLWSDQGKCSSPRLNWPAPPDTFPPWQSYARPLSPLSQPWILATPAWHHTAFLGSLNSSYSDLTIKVWYACAPLSTHLQSSRERYRVLWV